MGVKGDNGSQGVKGDKGEEGNPGLNGQFITKEESVNVSLHKCNSAVYYYNYYVQLQNKYS